MADFNRFLPMLLRFEGGFVNDPADPGGATNKGITLQTLRGCGPQLLGIAPTLDNLLALTDAQAGIVYKRQYWDPLRGDDITSQGWRTCWWTSMSTPAGMRSSSCSRR
ncbi:glycosyl hydrolase 108 family protein [Roseateles chitinivorans]|uniref:glycosyl hydrolase 108 family protein n=1 Tax=Roseateles chitinivorans TaxID=2917965 RepID=UPI003D67CD9D